MNRTDPHRPGTIDPTDYTYVLSYMTPGEEPFDQYNMEGVRDLCEGINWGQNEGGTAMFGHVGKCGVCGSRFRAGDVWRHEPTGDLVHLGHDCADKYNLVANRWDFDAAWESIKARRELIKKCTRRAREKEARTRQVDEFLASKPGLAEALQEDHSILSDMGNKLRMWGSLSDKQVAFAMKLAHELQEKRENKPVEEKHVTAPVGRQKIVGHVVGKRTDETQWGPSTKILVKVETPEGSWLTWGSTFDCADGKGDFIYNLQRGDQVEFTATVQSGKEPHFCFFKRPSKGRMVKRADEENVAEEAQLLDEVG
jgi:ribosomal protein L9